MEGTDKIDTSNGIVEMVGCDEYMSLGLDSVGQELMVEEQIFKVVQDQQQGESCLEQGSLDLASNVVGEFVGVSQEHRGIHRCPDVRWQHCNLISWGRSWRNEITGGEGGWNVSRGGRQWHIMRRNK